MKRRILMTAIIFLAHLCSAQTDTIDYFGQTPPGDSAVIFAPGIISLSNRLESKIAFSPDGNEVYFQVYASNSSSKIYYTKRINNTWTEQVEVPFSGGQNVGSPFISADGKRLYFDYWISGESRDIWMVEWTTEEWGEPQQLPAPVNSTYGEDSYTETADGVAYFTSDRTGGSGREDIWCLRSSSGQTENLGPGVNSADFDFSPCVAPDGSYLIFGSGRYGRGGAAHLYICFNKGSNGWTPPVNMNSGGAKINSDGAFQNGPSLSPDGKYLFFFRHINETIMDIYWASTNSISKLKKDAFAPKLNRQIPNISITTDSALNYIIPENTFSCEYGVETLKYEAALSNGLLLPSWLNFDSETRRLWGAPTQAGTDTIKITATNIDTVSASCTFRITVTDLTGIEEDNNHLPHELKLSQNYPNPFNPSTVISYHLSAFSNVKLTIYNVLGQKIKTLVNSFQSVGEHSIVWDATDEKNNPVSSGMYFYSLSTSERSVQKKMLLVR